ncbi:MAG: hypothetical protein LBK95_08925 [Bifidobacteriaceae bacterium]|jgi:folate-binding protein YgfZ|nr:hypothetical protein [Bifidobacteriaceae bacterium]
MGRYDLADQRAFAAGEPVFALSDAVGAVRLSGVDALKLLRALTTLSGEPEPGGTEALLLGGQGHIMFGLMAVPDGDDFLLLTDGPGTPGGADATGGPNATETRVGARHQPVFDAVADLLNSRRFRLQAEAAPLPSWKALVTRDWVDGIVQIGAQDPWPGGANLPRYALESPHPGTEWTGLTTYLYDPSEAQPLPDQLEARGYRQIDAASLEALRIAAWRPLASREAADSKTLPHELDWLRTTTALNSGCYPGQETVAKIINVGKPPRRLVFLHLDGADAVLPEAGAAVYDYPLPDDQRPVGRITSVGLHHELGPIALALVKRTLPEDECLVASVPEDPAGFIAASQVVIVPGSGESDSRPTARRTAPPKLASRRRG